MRKLQHYLKISTFSLLALALPLTGLAHLPTSANGKAISSLAPMLAKTTPAVVNIAVEKVLPKTPGQATLPADKQQPTKALAVGSGVIFNAKKGYIITNAHVVKNQKVMIVTLKDGRRYHAKLIGEEDGFDIAVIQIHADHLKQMQFGDSDKLKVGDFAVAVGSPFGLTQTVTSGVISALNRDTPKIEGFQSFIQTDAPINPGNSGGALIDMDGKLIGINTAILAPNKGNIGIGFSIPSNMVKSVADQLIKYGKVTPGLLGVMAQNISPELADALNLKNDKGVVVTQVVEGSAADNAGVKNEDIITKVNNTPIQSAAQLHNMMGIMRPGTKIHITVMRHHKEKILHAVVGNPKALLKQHYIPYLSGMRLEAFSDLEPNSTLVKGALVLDLKDNSSGALAGLLPGDIIVSANGQAISSIHKLMETAAHAKKRLLLKVARNNSYVYLVIQRNQ